MWNVHHLTIGNDPHTNNQLEAWHNRFQTAMGHHAHPAHPSIPKFMHVLRKEEVVISTEIVNLAAARPTCKKAARIQRSLRDLCLVFGEREAQGHNSVDFLRNFKL